MLLYGGGLNKPKYTSIIKQKNEFLCLRIRSFNYACANHFNPNTLINMKRECFLSEASPSFILGLFRKQLGHNWVSFTIDSLNENWI